VTEQRGNVAVSWQDRRVSNAAVEWLPASDEPAARRDLLGEDVDDPEAVMSGPKVRALMTDHPAAARSTWVN
jgi:hypothetical protein